MLSKEDQPQYCRMYNFLLLLHLSRRIVLGLKCCCLNSLGGIYLKFKMEKNKRI
jgi:hypothetical protein